LLASIRPHFDAAASLVSICSCMRAIALLLLPFTVGMFVCAGPVRAAGSVTSVDIMRKPACSAAQGAPKLVALLSSAAAAERACAAHALGALGQAATAGAVPSLIRLLTDVQIGKASRTSGRTALRAYRSAVWTYSDAKPMSYWGQGADNLFRVLKDVAGWVTSDSTAQADLQYDDISLHASYAVVAGATDNYPLIEVMHKRSEPVAAVFVRQTYHTPEGTGLLRSLEGDFDVVTAVIAVSDGDNSPEARIAFTFVNTSPGEEASWALARLRDPQALSTLIGIMSQPRGKGLDKTWLVRRMAIRTLGRMGDPAAVEPLIAALHTETEPLNRGFAMLALAEIGDHRAIEPLIEALKEKVRPLRTLAERALRRLSGQDFGRDQKAWRDWWLKQK
jgi:HEAT repeats